MSKNISISEGGTSKVFNDIDKIVLSDTSGGTDTWIPEDEANEYADTQEITINKNGVYEAPKSGVVGYRKVTVNVPNGGTAKEESGIIYDNLVTSIQKYIVNPKITKNASGYVWIGGENKTFTTSNTAKFTEKVSVIENKVRLVFNQITEPNDYTNIAESETNYLYINNRQVYFISIDNFSSGITYTSPKDFDSTITDEVLDMYKCRVIKPTNNSKILFDLSSSTATTTSGNDRVFNFNVGISFCDNGILNYTETQAEKTMQMCISGINGTKYGFIINENKTTGDVAFKLRLNNVDYPMIIGTVYDSESDAERDVGVVPEGFVGIIKQ